MRGESVPANFFTVDALARELRVSRATVYRRIQAGVIRTTRFGQALRISPQEVDRLTAEREAEAATPAEIEYLTPGHAVLEVEGEWKPYEPGDTIAPEVLALYCRPPRPRKAPALDESDCPSCQHAERAELDEAIRAATSSGGASNDELAKRFSLKPEAVRVHRAAGHVDDHGRDVEERRIAERDFSPKLALAVPLPWPRSGDSYVALAPLQMQDLTGAVRRLKPGELVHLDEVERAGRGIDGLVDAGRLARLPAAQGVIGLVGVLLERVAMLEARLAFEQAEGS